MSHPIAVALTRAIGMRVLEERKPVGGGSIHEAYCYRTERGPIFVKLGARSAANLFEAEAAGLRELAGAQAIRVPEVVACGESDGHAFLCMEWLELTRPTLRSQSLLGERLATLHARLGATHGWHQANFIGSTPQNNAPHADWPIFFRQQRLQPQLAMAKGNGADATTIERGHRLCEALDAFFHSYHPAPSLLHGDLWGGNWGATRDDEPVIFDPAVYFGDRETDLAMTRLFGGFSADFYAAYASAWPLDAGAPARVSLYNLYHVLNHFNLFGGSYLSQARSMIDDLLAAVGH